MNQQQPAASTATEKMDPRIDPDLHRKILGYLQLDEKIRSLGVRVIWPGRAVSSEEDAVAEVERMRAY